MTTDLNLLLLALKVHLLLNLLALLPIWQSIKLVKVWRRNFTMKPYTNLDSISKWNKISIWLLKTQKLLGFPQKTIPFQTWRKPYLKLIFLPEINMIHTKIMLFVCSVFIVYIKSWRHENWQKYANVRWFIKNTSCLMFLENHYKTNMLPLELLFCWKL